jgi:hypothetical protein
MSSHGNDVHLDRQPRLRRLGRYRWTTPIRPSLLGWCDPQRSSRSTCHQARSIFFQYLSLDRDSTYDTISKHIPIPRREDQLSRHPIWVCPHRRICRANRPELAPIPPSTTPIPKSFIQDSYPPQPVKVQSQQSKAEHSIKTPSATPHPRKLPPHSPFQVRCQKPFEADR